ncbi:MAG TPA: hypothetical protein VJ831_13850 [Jatrophihabitantaceae bacterium]|nr:hypothetical protein [Jatrophihabitantaceae bacterium]
MNPSAFGAALRIARRDTWRHKWRSLLVVLLIGFPVFALSCADIAYRSWQLDPNESVTRAIGSAQMAVQLGCDGGTVEQAPKAWLSDGFTCSQSNSDRRTATPTMATVLAQLPAGSRAIEQLLTPVRIRTSAGIKYAPLFGIDYSDPIAHGMYVQVHGRSPRTPNEIALSPRLAKSIGAHIGDTIHLADPDRAFTVVGIAREAGYRHSQLALTLPSAISTSSSRQPETTWYFHTPTPISWSRVLQLNKESLVVVSRSVYLDPPPRSQVPYYVHSGNNTNHAGVIAAVALIAGMALLEVVLLAGPAFAVGARRQRRDLALMAATGGQARDLRNVVLANGVVLGLLAGISAALGAVLAAFIAMPTLGTLVDQVPGHTEIRPLELAGIAMVSLVTALLAAIFPALQAARTDVIAALAGRRGTVRTRRHVPVIGLALIALGVAIALFAVTSQNNATTILVGVVFTEVGLIVCTPSVLGGAARLARLLPLGPRIALRDAGRNRSAATPAVAAVMASMIGAVGILVGVTSAQDRDKHSYQPTLPNHAVLASFGIPPTASEQADEVARIRTALAQNLPVESLATVRTPPDENCVGSTRSGSKVACKVGGVTLVEDSRVGGRYRSSAFPPVLVDDGSGVAALFGKPEPAAVAALRAGRAVVTDPNVLHGDTIQLGQVDERALDDNTGPVSALPITGTPVTIPATVVTDGFAPAAAIVPPSAMKSFGTPSVLGVLATTTRMPTDKEMQAAQGQIQAIDSGINVDIEKGWHDPAGWALWAMIGVAAAIALGAALIATALANTDGREDLVTLAAVGASPRTRRLMSMSRAGVVAGLGCLIGVAAGFVPAYAWVRGDRAALAENSRGIPDAIRGTSLHLVVPWTPIVLALVGVPIVAAAVAGMFTRSRLPSERSTS